MKRTVVVGVLALTILFVAGLYAQQPGATNGASVQSTPFVVQPAGFFQPFYSTAPFYINSEYHPNPPYVPSPPYNPTPNYSLPPEPPGPPAADEVQALKDQIEQLKAEVQLLREAQGPQVSETGESVAPVGATTSAPPPSKVVLALRDGRRIEVQDYVIVNGAVRIGYGKDVTTIPLSDLDVATTQSANGQRGAPLLAAVTSNR